MPNESTNIQPISDDQELAKVLAGVSADADDSQEEVTSLPPVPAAPDPAPVADDDSTTTSDDMTSLGQTTAAVEQPAPTPVVAPAAPAPVAADGELDTIKQQALGELRPLVDKLDVAPEEKFDTYLLLLRSTDDRELIAPAHEAAKNIADEARRAQALLDIIKEIDFLSQNQTS